MYDQSQTQQPRFGKYQHQCIKQNKNRLMQRMKTNTTSIRVVDWSGQ